MEIKQIKQKLLATTILFLKNIFLQIIQKKRLMEMLVLILFVFVLLHQKISVSQI